MPPYHLNFGTDTTLPRELITLPLSELTHAYFQGGTGQGKTSLLAYLLTSLIWQGVGVTVIDPGGDLSREVLVRLVITGYFHRFPDAKERVAYLDVQRAHEAQRYLPMNVLAGNYDAHAAAHVLLEGFKRVWPALQDGTSTNIETLVSNGAYVLAEHQLPLLPYLTRLYTKQGVYRALVPQIQDQEIAEQFKTLGLEPRPGYLPEISHTTVKRVNRLAFSPIIRYALSQQGNVLDAATLVNHNRSVLLNLHLTDPNAKKLMGCLITEHFEMFSKSRNKLTPEQERSRYVLAIDEVQNFAFQSGDAIANMHAEARKANVFVWIAHQYGAQLSEDFRAALSQCGIVVTFAVGPDDAVEGAKRLGFEVDPYKLKEVSFSPSGERNVYFSSSEQRDEHAQLIQRLRPREAYVRLPVNRRYMMRSLDLGQPTSTAMRLVEELEGDYLQRYFRPKAEIDREVATLLDRFAASQGDNQGDTINMVNPLKRPQPSPQPVTPPRRPPHNKTSTRPALVSQPSSPDEGNASLPKTDRPPAQKQPEPPLVSDDDLGLPEDEYDLF